MAFPLGFVSRALVALKSTTGDLSIMRALPWKTENRFRRTGSSPWRGFVTAAYRELAEPEA